DIAPAGRTGTKGNDRSDVVKKPRFSPGLTCIARARANASLSRRSIFLTNITHSESGLGGNRIYYEGQEASRRRTCRGLVRRLYVETSALLRAPRSDLVQRQ